jgi:hypothetical protein
MEAAFVFFWVTQKRKTEKKLIKIKAKLAKLHS